MSCEDHLPSFRASKLVKLCRELPQDKENPLVAEVQLEMACRCDDRVPGRSMGG